jgi:hypothetical protein
MRTRLTPADADEPFPFVMPGLVPGVHVFLLSCAKDVDGRDKPGHDERLVLLELPD